MMDSDTATNIGAIGTISGLLVLTVKYLIDSEARKIDELLQKQTEMLEELKTLHAMLESDDEDD